MIVFKEYLTDFLVKSGILQYYTRFMTRDSGGAKAPLNRNVTHYCKSGKR